MGYKIEYNPVKKVRFFPNRFSRIASLSGLFFLLFLFLTNLLWTEGWIMLQRLFLPDSVCQTAMLLNAFSEDLRSDVSLSDVIQLFVSQVTG